MLEIRLNFITDLIAPTHRLQNHCNNQIHLTDHPLHHSKREAQAARATTSSSTWGCSVGSSATF